MPRGARTVLRAVVGVISVSAGVNPRRPLFPLYPNKLYPCEVKVSTSSCSISLFLRDMFPETILLPIVPVAIEKIPPPLNSEEFPEMVLLLIVTTEPPLIPPPLSVTEFPEMVLLLIVNVLPP